jgi:membrane protease YdiL (CAAX protease family)
MPFKGIESGNLTTERKEELGILKKVSSLIIVFLVTQAIPILAKMISTIFNLSEIQNEPMRQLTYSVICYICQILLTLIVLKIYFKNNFSKVGFNFNNKKLSIKIFKSFIIIWLVIVVIFFIFALNFIDGFGAYNRNLSPPNFWYVIKNFVAAVMLAGIGEEPLFRSFVVLVLIKYWDGGIKIGKLTVPYVSLLSGFIFMIAHIGYTLYPSFTITHFDPLQLTFTFILGVFWATVFEKTRSLLCPVLAHSGANGIQYAVGFIVSFILK